MAEACAVFPRALLCYSFLLWSSFKLTWSDLSVCPRWPQAQRQQFWSLSGKKWWNWSLRQKRACGYPTAIDSEKTFLVALAGNMWRSNGNSYFHIVSAGPPLYTSSWNWVRCGVEWATSFEASVRSADSISAEVSCLSRHGQIQDNRFLGPLQSLRPLGRRLRDKHEFWQQVSQK